MSRWMEVSWCVFRFVLSPSPLPSGSIGLGPFVFGSYQVRPRLSHEFTVKENLGLFFKLHNLQPDQALHKSSILVTYRLLKNEKQLWSTTGTSDSIGQSGEQVTVNRLVALSLFARGQYKLEVEVRDRVSGQSLTRSAEFKLKP